MQKSHGSGSSMTILNLSIFPSSLIGQFNESKVSEDMYRLSRHLSLPTVHLTGHQGTCRPPRYSLSSLSWVFPMVSS